MNDRPQSTNEKQQKLNETSQRYAKVEKAVNQTINGNSKMLKTFATNMDKNQSG